MSPVRTVTPVIGMDPAAGGAPGGIRTPDPRIRNPVLYPTELRAPAAGLLARQRLRGLGGWRGGVGIGRPRRKHGLRSGDALEDMFAGGAQRRLDQGGERG